MNKKTIAIIAVILIATIIISSGVSFLITKNIYQNPAQTPQSTGVPTSTTTVTTTNTTTTTTTTTTTQPQPDEPNIDELVAEQIQMQKDEKIASLLESKVRLSCDENGNFKTLVLADIHAPGKIDPSLEQNIRMLVDTEKPNLVIFTGDNTLCSTEEDLRAALDSMVGYIESKGIAWCHVYGNHDHESGLSKEQMQAIYESYDYCVSKAGDENLFGVGNYVLPVYKYNSDEISSFVWCLDSGSRLSDEDREELIPTHPIDNVAMPDNILNGIQMGIHNSPYDYIHADQVQWYYSTSEFFEEYFGRKIPSIMAFHIPLQESFFAWSNRNGLDNWTGQKNEDISCSQINTGLFSAMVERGDVLAVVNGHDHTNTFMVEYKGVKLCYSPSPSPHSYNDPNTMGARVFISNSNSPTEITTYINYLFGN